MNGEKNQRNKAAILCDALAQRNMKICHIIFRLCWQRRPELAMLPWPW